MIKETWIAKIKETGCWTEKLITFCPFSPVSVWSKTLPNFAVKHVDLSWDFGHDLPYTGRRIEVNNEGGLDTRPSHLPYIGKLNPGCSSRAWHVIFMAIKGGGSWNLLKSEGGGQKSFVIFFFASAPLTSVELPPLESFYIGSSSPNGGSKIISIIRVFHKN